MARARRLAVERELAAIARALAAALVVLLLATGSASAQHITFGKNKVNYRNFDWAVLKGPHVHLYYYPEEDSLARIALDLAEKSYAQLSARFVHEVSGSIPVILYSSHHDFEQTNITPMLIPEGVGGLTEGLRGRVLVPFDGSFGQFSRTLQHELVHAFQRSMGERVLHERVRHRMPGPPLWFTEGLAEHWSGGWDADGDMVLRDMVLNGKLPAIDQFWMYEGTFTMYKLGQSVLDYIGKTYGEDKIGYFYIDAWKARKFDDLYELVLGVKLKDLSAGWMYATRQRYYPEVTTSEPLLQHARVVEPGPVTLKPVPVPAGIAGFADRFVFISPRSGYSTIYAAGLAEETHDEPHKLVTGERQPDYLSLHAFSSRMDISRDGVLVFSSQSGERDILNAYSLTKGEVLAHWGFADLVGISSPQWDASGRKIVFSGLRRDGQRDIYLFDSVSGDLVALTNDRFADADPAFHPDGKQIAFVSDRGPGGRNDARNIFLLDTESGQIRELTRGPWWDLSPAWSPDGERLLFVSTREGRRDLYVVDTTGRGARLTHSIEAILDPRWLPSGKEIIASIYADNRFRAAVVPLREPAPGDSFSQVSSVAMNEWHWDAPADTVRAEREAYSSKFALDIAQGGVAIDPSMGNDEGLQVLLRDMLGNRLLFFQLGNSTISTRDFLDNFSAGVTYIDLTRRLNRGVSVYHQAGDFEDEFGFPFFERRAGVSGVLSYPFSRFMRLETSLGLAYSEKNKPSTNVIRHAMITTHYFSWIYDTSLWRSTGPLDGERCHLTAGYTMNLRRPGVENWLLLADARRYFRIGQQATLALRLQGRFSDGPDPQVFLLGGSHSLRGYPWQDLHGTRSVLANAELRFPLLRGLLVDPIAIGPISFPGIEAALFTDAGQVWYSGWPDDWLGSYGVSFRMGLGGMMVLRLDMARRTDFHEWPSETHTEFFVGWDY